MEDPTVVLLTVGEDVDVLSEEIEKKGLRVVTCAFSDAEETIARSDPLLIVLQGPRGAVELSTLLEDNPGGRTRRVAVVAPRKDLALLMGLNRDIVVGLIAQEMTEKTAAARIEALVRQAAKQRGVAINLAARRMSLGPRPSLGARPSSAAVEAPLAVDTPALDLSQGLPAAQPTGTSTREEVGGKQERERTAPQQSAERRAARPMLAGPGEIPRAPRMPVETPEGPERSIPKPAPSDDSLDRSLLESPDLPAEEAGRAKDASKEPSPAPRAAPRHVEAEKKTLVGVATPATLGAIPLKKMSRPGTPTTEVAPPQPPFDLDGIDSLVPDSLRPSEIESYDEDSADAPDVPRADPLPQFDPSELLLDTADGDVGAGTAEEPAVGGSVVSEDGLPLVGLPDDSTHQELEEEAPESEASPATPRADAEALRLALERERSDAQAEEDEVTTILDENGEHVVPGSPEDEALEGHAVRGEGVQSPLSVRSPRTRTDSADREPPLPPEAATTEPASGTSALGGAAAASVGAGGVVEAEDVPGEKPGNKGLLVAAALLVAGGALVAYLVNAGPGVPRPSEETPQSAFPAAGEDAPGTLEEAGETANSQPSADAELDGEAPAVDGATEEVDAAAPTGDSVSPDENLTGEDAGELSTGSGSTGPDSFVKILDNPFKTPDADLAGCAELAPGVHAETSNLIAEASTHWAAARKLIVKGDIRGASQAMCTAVAINPESPATEGLARLFSLAHSPRRGMLWVEKAIERAPGDRDLINLRGDLKSQLGDQEGATQDWLSALSLTTDDPRRETQAREYALAGRRHRSIGDLPKAEQFFRRALGLSPKNLSALTGIADLMLARELYDNAGTFALQALDVFEAVPDTHLVLGDIAVQRKQPEAARASYQRALAIRPDFWPAKKRLRELSE